MIADASQTKYAVSDACGLPIEMIEGQLAQEPPESLLKNFRRGREQRNLEFKELLEWDQPQHRAKVEKSVLGMSNGRDGGVLVVGVEDDGSYSRLVGGGYQEIFPRLRRTGGQQLCFSVRRNRGDFRAYAAWEGRPGP